ncbi:pseudouridine-5'-phosphate glycosidase [Pseudoduganella sp. GCM10020061]|uniref:pseudouridine-5'-phosphate glycosidase n=1 Tax=Pseudoduganella sp. GCM10020061 TaxID=3317345 RepID=UPI0036291DAE
MHQYLLLSPEVASARAAGKPVVALESTIISHGMPYPQNVQTAKEVEQVIRDAGAVPATIALLDGKICIGLSDAQLELLGTSPDAIKVSRRDMAYVLSKRLVGATTVAATMICARMAGISVFVTGGIGGVHRGAETSFDISADLQELARTDVAVVCAGVKSILDIGLTLEYLETLGVPVVSVGQPGFPAFFTRESGFKADFQLDTPLEQASFIHTKWQLGLHGGVVVANPVPEASAMPKEEIDRITGQALREAGERGVTGKAVTPFLLARIKELTQGRSLATNIALVKHNAVVGAQLAVALHQIPGMQPV